jgi:LysM repeat protein
LLAVAAQAAPPSQSEDGQEYIVQAGDWLSKLAQAYYGDPLAYPVIVEATNAKAVQDDSFAVIENPDLIEVGQKLWIPGASPQVAGAGGLTPDALRNATYQGIYDEPVTLADGTYAGEPFVEGGASRPTVTLVDQLTALGDLNGDGLEDAAVVLAENSGGSGVFVYLAAVLSAEGRLANVDTLLLGDRVDIRSLTIQGGEILLTMLTQGPDDPFCCPSLEVTPRYRLEAGQLAELTDYVGVYHALLPAASSPGRDITLTLSADGTVEMSTDYLNQEPPIVQTGTWEKLGDGSIQVIFTGQDGRTYEQPETIYFRLLNEELVAVVYDINVYGSEGLRLQPQN